MDRGGKEPAKLVILFQRRFDELRVLLRFELLEKKAVAIDDFARAHRKDLEYGILTLSVEAEDVAFAPAHPSHLLTDAELFEHAHVVSKPRRFLETLLLRLGDHLPFE